MVNLASDEKVVYLMKGAIKATLKAPEGSVFKNCLNCENLFLYPKDEEIDECLDCLIKQQEAADDQ